MKPFTGQSLDSMQRDLANHYAQALSDMSKMVIHGVETQEHHPLSLPREVTIVANNEGYAKPEVFEENIIKGNVFQYRANNGNTYPLGYNIFIPQGVDKINKVMVSAYGGFVRADAESAVSTPSHAFRLAKHLLKEGCVVVELNLPDFLQTTFQQKMTEEMQSTIHAGIDSFFKQMRQNPSALSSALEKKGLQNADYFLGGASFGGRTALRHGQLYPGTFKGYISHDGAIAQRNFGFSDAITPVLHLNDTQEPVLILQNCDDNNVDVMTAVDFYQALIDAGKSHLARLCFFEKGNPMPTGEDKWNKGHFYPEHELSRYLDNIWRFMDGGPPAIPELHKLFFLKQKNITPAFTLRSSSSARCLGLAIQTYYDNPPHQAAFSKNEWEEIWQIVYLPLLRITKESTTLSDDNQYYRQYIDELVANNLLTDEVIANAIKHHSKVYQEYFRETAGFKKISLEDIYQNPYIIQEFRKKLVSPHYSDSKDSKMFMLESLLLSNPALLPALNQSKAWTEQTLGEESAKFKSQFESVIKETKENTQKAWRATIKKVIAKQKKQKKAFDKLPANAALQDASALYKHLFLLESDFIGNALEAKAAFDKKQAHVINTATEMAKEQLESLSQKQLAPECLEVVTLARELLSSEQYTLSLQSLEALKAFYAKNSSSPLPENQDTLKLIYSLLVIDKFRNSPLTPQNVVASIKRQVLLSAFLTDEVIEYEARRAYLEALHDLFPELSQSALLALIKHIDQDAVKAPYSIKDLIEEGNTALARALMQMGYAIEQENSLAAASKTQDVQLVEMLIQQGQQVTLTCLENAIEGSPQVLQLLYQHGGDPFLFPQAIQGKEAGHVVFDNPIFSKLVYRAMTESDPILTNLVQDIATKHGCRAELDTVTNVTTSLLKGELSETDIIESIKKNQISLSFKDATGQNLLMFAAKNNYIELFKFLMAQDLDPLQKDNQGNSALIHALFNNHADIAQLIIENEHKTTLKEADVKLIDFCKNKLCRERLYTYSKLKPVTTYYDNPTLTIDENLFNKLIQQAVTQGNIQCALELIVCVIGKDATDEIPEAGAERGRPLLRSALLQNALGFAASLIRAGADPNIADESNNAVLAFAIESRDADLVDLLISKKANPNGKNRYMQPSLSLAIGNLDTHLALRLIALGANVQGINNKNETHLCEAINHRLPEVAMALIHRGAPVNGVDSFGVDPLRRAIQNGFTNVAMALIEKGAEIDKPDWKNTTLLIELCRSMQLVDFIKELINRGANVNAKDKNGYTALMLALCLCRGEQQVMIAHLLIDKGADITVMDNDKNSAFWLAIQAGNFSLMDKLLQKGADIEAMHLNRRAPSSGATPLEWAIRSGNTELAAFLVQRGANVNARYHFGETPLSIAVSMGDKDMALKLIELGATVDSMNEIGNTPLAIAFERNHEDVALALIDKGANVQHVNNLPMPILMLASEALQQRVKEQTGAIQSRQKPIAHGLQAAQKMPTANKAEIKKIKKDRNQKPM